MAMDYPPEKLHVYVSDDGGSSITLNGMKEAWKFAKWWIPFCTRYRILCRCPEAYFSDSENDSDDLTENVEFVADKRIIKEKYEAFKEGIIRVKEDQDHFGDTASITSQNHPSIVEVIQENSSGEIEQVKLPLLVYVSREKRPSHPHHFKAGALNAL
ncbi:cellulose synthase-like protein g2-like, partial [Trifolium pratense]